MVAYSLVLGYFSYERCKDWYDSVSLWKDDIEKHPEAPVGYFYLGQEYFNRYEKTANPVEKKALADSALTNFNLSIQRKPDYVNPIICVAELQRSYGQVDAARDTYYKALKISPKNESAYLGLGVVYSIKQMYDSAGYCFRTALQLKPYSPEGHSNYANYFDITGRLDSSLAEYAIAIQQNPDAHIPYMNRARIFIRQNKVDDAMKDIATAMAISPETGDLYYLRAKCYALKGNKAQALKDVETAKAKGFTQIEQNFYNSLR
jgi:Tfp pilus assembly protein PilF